MGRKQIDIEERKEGKEKIKLDSNSMIIAKNLYYSLNDRNYLNNNTVIIGASGTGKTRNIVEPNIIQATGSYVISDPKGNLYDKYCTYLKEKGYAVYKIDFANPGRTPCKYNLFNKTIVKGDVEATFTNIIKLSHSIVSSYSAQYTNRSLDPFWDRSSEMLLASLIGYLAIYSEEKYRNFSNVNTLINALSPNEGKAAEKSALDFIFDQVEEMDPESPVLRHYKSFRVAAGKTLKSIQISTNVIIQHFCNAEIDNLMSGDDILNESIGKKKTALFICASDSDRTYDLLVDAVFYQIMSSLMKYADALRFKRLFMPVRFILDDFGTNVKIDDFPRMISCFRSRNISSMILLQSEAQLKKYYGDDADTILSNCDTYAYIGGNDVDTAYSVSLRANKTLNTILEMPPHNAWVFRRGQKPVYTELFDIDYFKKEKEFDVEVSL